MLYPTVVMKLKKSIARKNLLKEDKFTPTYVPVSGMKHITYDYQNKSYFIFDFYSLNLPM